jgi:hypothetical protein
MFLNDENRGEKGQKMLRLLIGIAGVILIVGGVYALFSGESLDVQNSDSNDSEKTDLKQGTDLIAAVGKHILLKDEEPTIATVRDVESLKRQQPFFDDAYNNDRLLIFSDKAIIYRESADIIVSVGPVQFSGEKKSDEEIDDNQTDSEPVEVEVRNGSGVKGEASKQKDIIGKLGSYSIVGFGNAAKQTYRGNLVVNLAGSDVTALVEEYSATIITALPFGERDSTADVVLILGK